MEPQTQSAPANRLHPTITKFRELDNLAGGDAENLPREYTDLVDSDEPGYLDGADLWDRLLADR